MNTEPNFEQTIALLIFSVVTAVLVTLAITAAWW